MYADLRVEPWMKAARSHHGGLLATAIDGSWARYPLATGAAVTGHLELDYLKPVPVGLTVRITAELLG